MESKLWENRWIRFANFFVIVVIFFLFFTVKSKHLKLVLPFLPLQGPYKKIKIAMASNEIPLKTTIKYT